MTHWVCKREGTIQCQDDPETTLDEMRTELARLVGEDGIIAQRKVTRPIIALCGAPTGRYNAYELTDHAYELLLRGIAGRQGFDDCPLDDDKSIDSGELSAATVLNALGVTSATHAPVLVRELIGRPLRVIVSGSPYTLDYRPARVNIITKDQVIRDIWYG